MLETSDISWSGCLGCRHLLGVTMAGESASESARRQREKAERLQRSAEMWERGAEGERRTAEVLSALPAESWTVFHDLRWPGRRFANVDHVVVGPPGVFVIDSKNWSGTIRVNNNVLSVNKYAKEREVAGAAEAALAIGQLVPLLRPDLVRPVLCFVRDEEISGWVRDVMITSTSTLVDMLASRPPMLSAEDVRQVALDLDGGIRTAMAAPVAEGPRRNAQIAGAAPRVAATPAPRPTKRSRPNRNAVKDDLVKLVGLVAVLVILLGAFGIRDGVAGWLTDLITSSTIQDPAQERKPTDDADKCRQHPDKPSCTGKPGSR